MARKLIRAAGRAAGPKGSWRRRWSVLLTLVVAVGGAMVVWQNVSAVHLDGFFELDRDALRADDTGLQCTTLPTDPGCGEDWEDIWDAFEANDPTLTAAKAFTFVPDGEGPTTFTGGSTKDDLDTTGWKHTTGSSQPKDELLDGFAARYNDHLYFGADRTANNGDAVMGFWFFQQQVGPCTAANTVTCGPVGSFGPGKHEDGDILVLSDFTKGGGFVTVRVYRWNGPDDPNDPNPPFPGVGAIDGTLDLIAGGPDPNDPTKNIPADCIGPPAVGDLDEFCATVNTAGSVAPWPFNPKVKVKGAPANSFAPGEFYEGGIDLAFLNLEGECFSSFLAESRASQSTDSTLSDFVGGQFEQCSGVLTTQASTTGTVPPGTPVTDTAWVQISTSGGGTGVADPQGTITFSICGPTTTKVACTAADPTNTPVGSPVNLSNAACLAPAPTSTGDSDGLRCAASVSVNGSTPLAPGNYCFLATADLTNYDDPDEFSNSTTECFTVQDTSGILTTQDWLPNDQAVVSSTNGSKLGGTLDITLHAGGDCTGTVLYTEPTITFSGNNATETHTTNNTTVKVTVAGPTTVSWKSVYSGSTGVVGFTRCERTSGLTITNTGIPFPPTP
jgi:hypothetical protein